MNDICSLHSWSNVGIPSAGYSWTSCCYQGADDAKCMWHKPFEILKQTKANSQIARGRSNNIDMAPSISKGPRETNGVPHGFEISIGPVGRKDGFSDYNDANEEESINGWMMSPDHRAVLLNEGMWKDVEWNKIGAAKYGPFANVWFSE